MTTVDVSIIIINYNTFALTCGCLESIVEKTIGLTYEIILVDNNSSERQPDRFLDLFPEIILIKSPTNVGFAKGCNLGIEVAKGTLILLLNSDTLLQNNAIMIAKEFLERHVKVAVVSSILLFPDGRVQNNCQRFPSIKYTLFELLRLQKIFSKKRAGKILFGSFFNYREIAYPDWVWGTFFMFRKELLKQLAGEKLADNFFMYGEDMLWCMEFRLRGYSVAFLPEAKTIHHMGQSAGAKSLLMKKNLEVFMHKYYPRWQATLIHWLNNTLILTNG